MWVAQASNKKLEKGSIVNLEEEGSAFSEVTSLPFCNLANLLTVITASSLVDSGLLVAPLVLQLPELWE